MKAFTTVVLASTASATYIYGTGVTTTTTSSPAVYYPTSVSSVSPSSSPAVYYPTSVSSVSPSSSPAVYYPTSVSSVSPPPPASDSDCLTSTPVTHTGYPTLTPSVSKNTTSTYWTTYVQPSSSSVSGYPSVSRNVTYSATAKPSGPSSSRSTQLPTNTPVPAGAGTITAMSGLLGLVGLTMAIAF